MFHKEGYNIIILFFIAVSVDVIFLEVIIKESPILKNFLQTSALTLLIFILWFFRNPKRKLNRNSNYVISPADGKIVSIEEVVEDEFFKDRRLQISIFLSPLDVHVNRYPVSGEVLYSKYHQGDYIVAWHPKSSKKNERTTVVINTEKYGEIMYRQIAGAVARRIINYSKTGDLVTQGKDAGFIKFGSRVDLFLPLNSKINVNLNQTVKGAETVISEYLKS